VSGSEFILQARMAEQSGRVVALINVIELNVDEQEAFDG
jgi:hypothetical protein